MERSRTDRRARWGAACAPCAIAKTRCIRSQSPRQQQCDRCRSLEKDCMAQTSGPRKKRQAKSSFDTRMALRKKGLENLGFSSGTPERESSTVLGSSLHNDLYDIADVPSVSSVSHEPQPHDLQREETAMNTPAQDHVPNSAQAGQVCTCMARLNAEDLVPMESDETLLSIYRIQLSSSFPFVIIPPDTTPAQLQASRPFLMMVIKMVASVRHLRSLRGQSRAVMEHIASAILIKSERSLDLLQGILVILQSYHYHCMAHAQFNNLLRLAVSLVEDLALNTCPKSPRRRNQLPLLHAEEPSYRTYEERRALLGTWYFSSSACLVVKQLTFTRYTEYMDQCLRDLDETGEYETDKLVLELIRVQQLTEKIFNFHSGDSPLDEQIGLSRPSMMTRLDTLRAEADSLRNVISSHFESHYYLICYHHSASLRIFEPILSGSHLPDADCQSFASLSALGVQIVDVFTHFTTALKAWVNHWLTIPVCSYFYMPQPAYVQLVHGAMMLSRWVRVAGSAAVMRSNAGASKSQKVSAMASHPMPALSGVPSCPDLSLPRPSDSRPTHAVSAQILKVLRAKVKEQSSLQIDVLGILDTMAARFEAAKKEMIAAQGLNWDNDTWDFAAEHSRMKKVKIEKWCDMIAMAADEGESPPTDVHDRVRGGSGDTTNVMSGPSIEDFGWMTSENDWNKMQWESALFDEILQDIHA